MALTLSAPVLAQGKGKGGGNGNGHQSAPPSSIPLPGPGTGSVTAASPLAWLDDASLLPTGLVSLSLSAMHWAGTDLSQVDVPIVDASIGLAPRFQVGATVPYVVGNADGSVAGGVGTSYIRSKIALLTGQSGVKLAVSPMIEVLSGAAAQALSPDQGRTQLGVPVSLEVAQGPARVFASTGFFTRGAWFAGGGVGFQPAPTVGLSLGFTRSWADAGATGVTLDRRELIGSASYFIRPEIGVYGALGRTIATADGSGAGTTVTGGVTFFVKANFSRN
jgi:hypothetical protein